MAEMYKVRKEFRLKKKPAFARISRSKKLLFQPPPWWVGEGELIADQRKSIPLCLNKGGEKGFLHSDGRWG